jgi:hypothetical protein
MQTVVSRCPATAPRVSAIAQGADFRVADPAARARPARSNVITSIAGPRGGTVRDSGLGHGK